MKGWTSFGNKRIFIMDYMDNGKDNVGCIISVPLNYVQSIYSRSRMEFVTILREVVATTTTRPLILDLQSLHCMDLTSQDMLDLILLVCPKVKIRAIATNLTSGKETEITMHVASDGLTLKQEPGFTYSYSYYIL